MTLHSPTENSLAVLNHKILEANSQVQNVKLGGHQTCLSINRLWHELCDMLRRLVSNHGSIPITIDCNVVAFIVFEEDDWNVDVPSWKYPRNLESPRLSSPGFDNDSKMMLSDSRRTLIWRAPGTRYHQENTIERHRYGGAGWLVWGGIILGSRTDLHVQSVTMTGHIYRDVILEQHVRSFRGAMVAEFLFMDDNARPHRVQTL
ncbi:DDE_3 domain-containing protein [Trichonephila clavipes]|uniref:DDE_3 domain-containing protein n=1 Tax=Trichonephila clavipes TaxID=2585209 RepID=A0A8X6RBP0_TRICX|nr:DDE_3 domain-containing protein [Trichonephila clavipes]